MPGTMEPDYIAAHRHAFKSREELMNSDICGCFYCLKMFPPNQIKDWVDDGLTALCPECSIDSVIGSASGFTIDITLLREMEKYWFG